MVRTIIIPEKEVVSFNVPSNYVGKEIEVIAFEKNEGVKEEKLLKKNVSFDALVLDTRGYKFNREEANER